MGPEPPRGSGFVRVGGGASAGTSSMATGAAAALGFLNQESRCRAGGAGSLRVPTPVTMDSFFFGIQKRRGWGCYWVTGRAGEQKCRCVRDVGGDSGGLARGRWSGRGGQAPVLFVQGGRSTWT